MLYYLDSSAWVKCYYDESGSDWIVKLFEKENVLACSTLGRVEITGVIARKHKAKAITARQIQMIYNSMDKDWSLFIQIQITEEIVELACELAKSHALRGADAIHLSSLNILRERLSLDNNSPIFVVSDKELKKAALTLGFEVIDPEDKFPKR